MKLTYKNIIITGASSGIGSEVMKLLEKKEGNRIIAVARDVSKIKAKEGHVIPYSADLTKKEEIDELFSFVQEKFGRIDVFIANAGFGYLEEITEPDWDRIENIFKLNVFSPIYSLEKMVMQPNKNKEKIVFAVTASVAGLKALPGYSLYSSSKFAVNGFMETFKYEKQDNVILTTVYPVATRTAFFDKASGEEKTPMPWPRQKAKTVAKSIVRGIEKEKRRIFPSFLFRLARPFPFIVNSFMRKEHKRFEAWRTAKQKNISEEVVVVEQNKEIQIRNKAD